MDPSNTSGARYQRVATPSVNIGEFSSLAAKDLTKPKSHNFIVQLEFTKIFEGFKSRWITDPECKYFNALANWYTINLICTSFKIPSAITLCKSAYINSKIKYTSLLFSALKVSNNFTMFGWSIWRNISIYRYVLCASVECWNASNIFLSAYTFLVVFS